jgi:hypothetical protein
VSEGQRLGFHELEKEFQDLAACCACKERGTESKQCWQLARKLKAVEARIGRKLTNAELALAFDEWYCLSQSFLDGVTPHGDYFTAFLAQFAKVRVPAGEGTLTTALKIVSKLSDPDLPVIPDYPDAPQKSRLLAALHRELSRLSTQKNKTYFLSYRDAAKVSDGLNHQEAHKITLALKSLGVIDIVNSGQAGLNGAKAAEFQYLLVKTETAADDFEL